MTRQKPILKCVVGWWSDGNGNRKFCQARCDITLGKYRKGGLLFLAVRTKHKNVINVGQDMTEPLTSGCMRPTTSHKKNLSLDGISNALT